MSTRDDHSSEPSNPHEGFILVESPEQVDGDVAEKVTEELFALIMTQYEGRPTSLVID